MPANFKNPTRREIILVAVLLALVSIVFLVFQERKKETAVFQPENQDAPSGQSASNRENERQNIAAAVSQNRQPSEPRPPAVQSREQDAAGPSATPRISGSFQNLRLIHKVDPIYPELAKEYEISDIVELDVTVNEKGIVAETVVTSGRQLFAEAAVSAVSQWRYEPAVINGMPTPLSFDVVINFIDGTISNSFKRMVEADPSIYISGTANQFALPFHTYNGRQYYTATSVMSAPIVHADMARLQQVVNAGWPTDDRVKDFFLYPILYTIYINEKGGVDGLDRRSGPKIAALEAELKNIRALSPAMFDGKAIPSWVSLTIDVPDFVKNK